MNENWKLFVCSVLLLAIPFGVCGCSQFSAPEIEVASQSLADPFDKAVEAARTGDLSYIKECVQSDARYVEAYDGTGRTLLHYAAEHGDADAVSFLLESGAYALAEDDEGYSALDIAIRSVAPQGVIDQLREATINQANAS